ncbi:radixin isoform a [Capsaspora owczarzaki ATCC 30864]|uniref:Radixin isoform a n=1 Tax=Capsaspora owczarzaki (strain ATCC 30864) TaxID=595528 RepID=A0A0D2VKE7_CAPO3|nr:radixin isoform a [Capsaspora owczarzaki ATCC 30864]KJE90487.1 radixin isoform a [Capsaspora owczarzaki ATCC 30864]|eukprot:XP_004364665.2 radixin isoform a [Capsaspora owczarzaki ATCC 30864]
MPLRGRAFVLTQEAVAAHGLFGGLPDSGLSILPSQSSSLALQLPADVPLVTASGSHAVVAGAGNGSSGVSAPASSSDWRQQDPQAGQATTSHSLPSTAQERHSRGSNSSNSSIERSTFLQRVFVLHRVPSVVNVVVSSLPTKFGAPLTDVTVLASTQPGNITGRQIFDTAARLLGIREVCFFGLAYQAMDGAPAWVTLDKRIRKHDVLRMDKSDPAAPYQLRMRFKFFPEDAVEQVILDRTRHYLVLQLHESICSSQLYCPAEMCVLLASYYVQAKHGDYNSRVHVPGFLSGDTLMPQRVKSQYNMTDAMWEERILACHAEHQGMSLEEALVEYLKIAQDLEMFGVEFFPIKNKKGTDVWLGIDARGLSIYELNDKLNPKIAFPWSEIQQVGYVDTQFIITVNDRRSPDVVLIVPSKRINKRITHMCLGNYQMYLRGRANATLEHELFQAEAQHERLRRETQKQRLLLERSARVEAERARYELELRLQQAEEHAKQWEYAFRRSEETAELMFEKATIAEEEARLLMRKALEAEETKMRIMKTAVRTAEEKAEMGRKAKEAEEVAARLAFQAKRAEAQAVQLRSQLLFQQQQRLNQGAAPSTPVGTTTGASASAGGGRFVPHGSSSSSSSNSKSPAPAHTLYSPTVPASGSSHARPSKDTSPIPNTYSNTTMQSTSSSSSASSLHGTAHHPLHLTPAQHHAQMRQSNSHHTIDPATAGRGQHSALGTVAASAPNVFAYTSHSPVPMPVQSHHPEPRMGRQSSEVFTTSIATLPSLNSSGSETAISQLTRRDSGNSARSAHGGAGLAPPNGLAPDNRSLIAQNGSPTTLRRSMHASTAAARLSIPSFDSSTGASLASEVHSARMSLSNVQFSRQPSYRLSSYAPGSPHSANGAQVETSLGQLGHDGAGGDAGAGTGLRDVDTRPPGDASTQLASQIKKERREHLGTSKTLQVQLRSLIADIMPLRRTEMASELDEIHESNVQLGKTKYATLRLIRKGTTHDRINKFESM